MSRTRLRSKRRNDTSSTTTSNPVNHEEALRFATRNIRQKDDILAKHRKLVFDQPRNATAASSIAKFVLSTRSSDTHAASSDGKANSSELLAKTSALSAALLSTLTRLNEKEKNTAASRNESVSHGESKRKKTTGVPAFLKKVLAICNDSPKEIVSWNSTGTTFFVHHTDRFAKEVQPHYFSSSNFHSFVRQLNFYGFKKISVGRKGAWEFKHDHFVRDKPDLMTKIKRKTCIDKEQASKQVIQSLRNEVSELQSDLGSLTEKISAIVKVLGSVLQENADLLSENQTKKSLEDVVEGFKDEGSNFVNAHPFMMDDSKRVTSRRRDRSIMEEPIEDDYDVPEYFHADKKPRLSRGLSSSSLNDSMMWKNFEESLDFEDPINFVDVSPITDLDSLATDIDFSNSFTHKPAVVF